MLIHEMNLLLNDLERNYVCVSRPRRFGKSLAENMLSAYYSKGADSKELFSALKISKSKSLFRKKRNIYNHSAISLAYITGILPVVREKIQSKLNTFHE